MPQGDTAIISFGNWIVAFYLVYAVAAIAVVAALAVFADWTINRVKATRLATQAKPGRTQVARSQG